MSFEHTALRQARFWRARSTDVVHSWREMVRPRSLPVDIAAGLGVACVALPLNIALATAAGMPPSAGVVAGIVAGVIGALFSGHRLQVTGPEAALLPTAATLVAAHGVAGLAAATVMAGVLQMLLGVFRMGRLARLIPRPVVVGFTTGIGLVLLGTQLPRLLGLDETHPHVVDLFTVPGAFANVSWPGVVFGVLAATAMILLPRVHKRIPAALVGLVVATCAAIGFGGSYEAIGALPQSLPAPVLPSFAGLDWPRFLPSALALAFLASLGSLLATSSLDALHPARQASDLDQDLVAHGLANIVAGLFGGFPVMGAIVRAGASVQMGARTRAASMSHALWLLVAMMALAPWVARIPVPALTAILLVVAGRLLNLEGLVAMFKEAKSVFAIVVVTAVTIAAFGFIVGIAAGIFLAAGLYVHRHGALRLDLLRDGDTLTHARVHGPLLFINHMKLYTLIEGSSWSKLTAIDLSRTSYVDAAGVQTLAYLAEFLAIRGSKLVLVGVPGHLHERLEDVVPHLLGGRLHADVDDALVSAGLRTPPALPEVRPAPQRPERRSLTA